LKIFFKDIPKDVIQIISNYAAEDFDYFNLSTAVQLKFIVDFSDTMNEDDLPLDSFDHVKHDYPTYDFTVTRAYNVFYWWPSDQEKERKQELELMCRHMQDVDGFMEFVYDNSNAYLLDLNDTLYGYGSFNHFDIQTHVEKELKAGKAKIEIIMQVYPGDE